MTLRLIFDWPSFYGQPPIGYSGLRTPRNQPPPGHKARLMVFGQARPQELSDQTKGRKYGRFVFVEYLGAGARVHRADKGTK